MSDTMYVMAIDQGTTSTRAIIFDHSGRSIASGQKEHEQIFPRAGWVEHDPKEVWANTREVVGQALSAANINRHQLAAVGITNQRETTVVWNRFTGQPYGNAIVWQDTRTAELCNELAKNGGQDRFRPLVGLPLATYFSGLKIRWMLDHTPGLQYAAEKGEALFGNIDTWLVWNLTGGPRGGLHITDVTNASRTMLMNINTLDWDPSILDLLNIPRSMLPNIRSSSEVYGYIQDILPGIPIAGVLGDQHAALFGQACFEPGDAKNTYGTGCFMLMNTGTQPTQSQFGLLTTLGYKIGNQPAVYALEGSIAIAGALVQWLRDNLGIIEKSTDIEPLARTVEDNGGAYFVPAFSGLFAPYWRSDARGVIAGLTRFVNRGHLARAVLEATAYQTREVAEAMAKDSGVLLSKLKVDGGMVANELLMQFQADILNAPVVRPRIAEITALGAAYAAGLAVGFWKDFASLRANWQEDRSWSPQMDEIRREKYYSSWKKAVTRTMGWIES